MKIEPSLCPVIKSADQHPEVVVFVLERRRMSRDIQGDENDSVCTRCKVILRSWLAMFLM